MDVTQSKFDRWGKLAALSVFLIALWAPADATQFAPPPPPTALQGFGYGFQSGIASTGCATAPNPQVYGYQPWQQPQGYTCSTLGGYTTCQ